MRAGGHGSFISHELLERTGLDNLFHCARQNFLGGGDVRISGCFLNKLNVTVKLLPWAAENGKENPLSEHRADTQNIPQYFAREAEEAAQFGDAPVGLFS